MTNIKKAHCKARKPSPAKKNAECKKTLTYNGQGIPRGKGFQRVPPHCTFSSLVKKKEEYDANIKASRK
jgi:hypothetical protein